MASTGSAEGSCHCGNVQFRVHAPVESLMSCNCSLCRRSGWLLAFVDATQFEVVSGEEHLRDYQFGKKHVHHTFCTTCGVRPFSQGPNPEGGVTYAVNMRCVPDFDLTSLPVHEYDGAQA